MVTPIRPGTARRLGLRDPRRLQPGAILTVDEHLTEETMERFKLAFAEAIQEPAARLLEYPTIGTERRWVWPGA